MKYFLDSAKLDEIKYAYETFGIDGITTNPNHIKKSGKSFYQVLEDISNWVKDEDIEGYENFPISVEINPELNDADEMVKMGKEIGSLCKNFVIKIPCTEAGVTASRKLEKEGVRTNLTLVFSPSQAIAAGRNNCLFVSPFIGWKEANGEDCKEYIKNIVEIYKNFGYYGKTEIICAAVRNPKQIVDCAVAGADIITAGLAVYQDSFYHAYTTEGLKKFIDAWKSTDTKRR